MPDTKISDLTDGTTANATDRLPVARAGANVYVTPAYLSTYLDGIAHTWTALQTFSGAITGGSNTIEQRNGTNAQLSYIYNTYTDGSNYERGFMRWSSNVLQIGAEKAGTGTARQLTLFSGTGALRAEAGTGNGMDFILSTGDAGVVNSNCALRIRANSSDIGYIGRISSVYGIFEGSASQIITFPGSQAANVLGVLTAASGTATPANGSTAARLLLGTTAGFGIYYGSGAPSVSAAQGSIYLRSDGSSTSTRLYVNTNGSTTWTNVTTAA